MKTSLPDPLIAVIHGVVGGIVASLLLTLLLTLLLRTVGITAGGIVGTLLIETVSLGALILGAWWSAHTISNTYYITHPLLVCDCNGTGNALCTCSRRVCDIKRPSKCVGARYLPHRFHPRHRTHPHPTYFL